MQAAGLYDVGALDDEEGDQMGDEVEMFSDLDEYDDM